MFCAQFQVRSRARVQATFGYLETSGSRGYQIRKFLNEYQTKSDQFRRHNLITLKCLGEGSILWQRGQARDACFLMGNQISET